jgi:hypothetical protein
MPDENNTVKVAGAEPDKTKTVEVAVAETAGKDAKADSSTESVPWDKDPRWKSARTAEKKLKDLLKANDLEDADDLVDLVQKGKAVKGKLADLNQLDEIIEKAAKLDKYESYWREQEEQKRRNVETPDDTIKRLENQLKGRELAEGRKREQARQVENTKRAITAYESEVGNLVHELEIPKEQHSFMLELFGVNNPCNDIDITDRKAIKRLVSEGVKKKEAYDQAVIKAYLDTKRETPRVAATAGSGADEKKPKMMLKDARKVFLERMQNIGG